MPLIDMMSAGFGSARGLRSGSSSGASFSSGKTVSEIADELSLSVKTISTYRSRILDKMKMKNNAELMRYALQHKVVE